MGYEPIKCEQCGMSINVDTSKGSYTCPYCGTKYQKKTDYTNNTNTGNNFDTDFINNAFNALNDMNSSGIRVYKSVYSPMQNLNWKVNTSFNSNGEKLINLIVCEKEELDALSVLECFKYTIISSNYIDLGFKNIIAKRTVNQELENELSSLEPEYFNLKASQNINSQYSKAFLKSGFIPFLMGAIMTFEITIILHIPLSIAEINSFSYFIILAFIGSLVCLFFTFRAYNKYKEKKEKINMINNQNKNRMEEILETVKRLTNEYNNVYEEAIK